MNTNQQKTTESKEKKVGFLYSDLTYKINGLLIEVYKELGPYAKEKQYSAALEKKFIANGIQYKRELIIGDTGNVVVFSSVSLMFL